MYGCFCIHLVCNKCGNVVYGEGNIQHILLIYAMSSLICVAIWNHLKLPKNAKIIVILLDVL